MRLRCKWYVASLCMNWKAWVVWLVVIHDISIIGTFWLVGRSCIFWTSIMLDGDKKIFMTITLNFSIVVNKSYLYNYSEKITVWLIMS